MRLHSLCNENLVPRQLFNSETTTQVYSFLLRFNLKLSLVLLHFFPLPLRVAFLSYPYVYTPRSIRVFEAEREAIIFFRKYVTVLMKDIIQLLSSFSESVYTREKNDQKAVDGALIKAIEVVSELNNCLGTRFSLHKEWSRISLFS